ncbi:sporulation protein YqfD [Sporosarcina sp. G11-34]|uniref:sporulation protein YqfD n=1 Tax=Sporosarcina sp. G11-34 TaxID=2849605 RepID=UPI0022A9023C|nr:sporulation protein YqfD [Sporosarcina sp. G11-34]
MKSVSAKIISLSVDEKGAHFRTDRNGVGQVRKYRRKYRVKVTITQTITHSNAGAFFTSYRYFLVFIIPFVASFFLWTVDVESDIPEVVERIEEKLTASSIVPLRPLMLIPDEGEIRRELMQDDMSLSWVRFKRVGTTLLVIPMLSPITNVQKEVNEQPSDLVAYTGGVITRFELKRGERATHVHETVKKGDTLATGVLEQGDKKTVVGADGAVYADYWLEYSFSLPKTIQYKVQGEEKVEIAFAAPWKSQPNKEESENDLRNIFSRLITVERHVDEVKEKLELKEGTEHTILIPLLKQKLLSERSASLIIKDDKILHVTFDNDKVNGTILFLVNDNIAVKRPIPQGD